MREETGSAMLVAGARVFLDDRIVGLIRLGQRALPGNAAFQFINAIGLGGRHIALAAGEDKAGA